MSRRYGSLGIILWRATSVVRAGSMTPWWDGLDILRTAEWPAPLRVNTLFPHENKHKQTFSGIQSRVGSGGHQILGSVHFINSTLYPTYHMIKKTFVKLRRINSPDNCHTLDVSKLQAVNKTFNKKSIEVLSFAFDYSLDFSFEIHIEDRELMLDRDNAENRRAYMGSPIVLSNLSLSTWSKYSIDIRQSIYPEEDEALGCKNYPWGGFQTYNDCDEGFMEDYLNKNYPPSVRPFFMLKNQSRASVGPVEMQRSNLLFQTDGPDFVYFQGYTQSDCPKPCKQTFIAGSHNSAQPFKGLKNNQSFIELILPKTMIVTTTFYPTFNIVDTLAGVGGLFGLWLGLGILQLLDSVINLLMFHLGKNNRE